MRKGDEKRQELLNASEKLFCQRGYEATSVQDILNELHLSKGGFYHHFASKEEVLRALCDRRADRANAFTVNLLPQMQTPLARLNAVLYGFMPLRLDEADFVQMLLPIIGKPEGRAIAMAYQEALSKAFLPMLKAEVASAAAVDLLFPPVQDMEQVVLQIVNDCWMRVAAWTQQAVEEGRPIDANMLLSILEKYRRAVEVLLDAPYGTIEIVRIEEWCEVIQKCIRPGRPE